MADSPPQPPPPTPTTITALSDDILREIFLRLPSVTSLARAAFACRVFLHAVRSSPAFRRRFRELRAPPLLALFLMPDMRAIVPAAAGKSSDIAAAFDGLLHDSDASEWRTHLPLRIPYTHGFANFASRATDQSTCYSPHSQALNIFPKNLRYGYDYGAFLEFHTLSPDGEEQRPSRVVCVHHDRDWTWACVAVFSSRTMEWQVISREIRNRMLLPESDTYAAGIVVNGFVCWVHLYEGCILALDTATFQFSLMDLPPLVGRFQLGQTKDGELCLVDVLNCMLAVWLWAVDDDGVGAFMLHKMFSLHADVSKVTERAEEADVGRRTTVVINGFVYLSVAYLRDPQSPEWFMSFCLETDEVNFLHKENQLLPCVADPYIMVRWPSSLINSKEDSETGVTGNNSEDDGPIGTEEASPVLFTSMQSFKEKLIDGNSNFAYIECFLLDDERNSLLNRITTLESGLAAARDHVLRIGVKSDSMEVMEIVASESGFTSCKRPCLENRY